MVFLFLDICKPIWVVYVCASVSWMGLWPLLLNTMVDHLFRYLSYFGQNIAKLYLLGNCHALLSSADFFKINFFEKFFLEYHQSVKQLDPDQV